MLGDAGSMVFDPKSFMATNEAVFRFYDWASMPPSDSSKPVDILSQFKVHSITHNKTPANEFLAIETVDQSNKPYLFILQRSVSNKPSPYRMIRIGPLGSVEEIGKFIATLAASITTLAASIITLAASITVPYESRDLPEGSSSSSSSYSPSTTFDDGSLSIGDSLDKSDVFPVNDFFWGQNFAQSAKRHGQVVRYFKPDHLTLFELVLLANVVHEMHPTYSILREQCHFYVRLVYTALSALENYFCVSASKSADGSKDQVVCDFESHRFTVEYGHWKGPMVNKIEEETVFKVISAYKIAYHKEVAKINKRASAWNI